MKAKISEHDIQKQILDWLKVKGIFHFRNNSGAMMSNYKGKARFMRFGALGSPDIFAFINGRTFGIEVKGATGKLSDYQCVFGRNLQSAGGVYIVAYCLEHVTEILEAEIKS